MKCLPVFFQIQKVELTWTEPSSAGSCIKVLFYRGVKVRTTDDFGVERCGHVLITPSGLLFQQVMSPQSPSLFFIAVYFSFVFSAACSLVFVSPSMSYHISACCLNQINFQGVGMMSFFLGLLFHLTACSLLFPGGSVITHSRSVDLCFIVAWAQKTEG